jgi:hypothetical protein
LAGSLIGIKFVSESVYEIRIPFESQNASLITIQIIPIAIPLLQPVILLKRFGNGFPCLLNWKLQINNPACIKAMSILYRLVILMELLQGIKG